MMPNSSDVKRLRRQVDLETKAALSGGRAKFLLVGSVVLGIVLFVFAVGIVGMVGAALSASVLALIPTSLSATLLCLGLALLVIPIVFCVALWRRRRDTMLVALTLLYALFVLFLGVGIVAATEAEFSTGASVLLHAAWVSAPSSAQASVEKMFNCCGFDSIDDFYGPQWNVNCVYNQSFASCCDLRVPSNLPSPPANTSAPFHCSHTKLRCCIDLSIDHYPCYELPSCSVATAEWARSHFYAFAGVGLTVSVLTAFTLVVWTLTYVLIKRRDQIVMNGYDAAAISELNGNAFDANGEESF